MGIGEKEGFGFVVFEGEVDTPMHTMLENLCFNEADEFMPSLFTYTIRYLFFFFCLVSISL